MALKYLEKIEGSDNVKESSVYESQETLSVASNGSTIILPNNAGRVNSFLVGLIISSGTGKVQFTLSKHADVIAENANVNWIDWDAGSVTSTTTDEFGPVTAVRAVNTAGTVLLEVRAS